MLCSLFSRTDITIYIALCIGFGVYKVVELFNPAVPFLHSYFEDLVALPIVLKTALLTVQLLKESWRSYQFGKLELISITVLFALYFEGFLPYYFPSFTMDMWDIGCYGIGALAFGRWMNRPLLMNTEKS